MHWRTEELNALTLVLRDHKNKTISVDGQTLTTQMISTMQTSTSLILDIELRDTDNRPHRIVLKSDLLSKE